MSTPGRILAGIAIMLTTGLGPAQIANATVESGTTPASTTTVLAGAPCIVTGYSLHAEQEMAADHITSDHVETVVYNTCSRAKKQSNGRYKYTDGKITVIAEPSGYVVTAWRN